MRIDIDRSAILTKETPIINTIKASNKESSTVFNSNDRIAVLRRDNEIFLPPSTIIGYLGTYLHEVGHVIGDKLSFQAGKGDDSEAQVLSFDDVKNPNTIITLSDHEIAFLKENTFHGQIIEYSDAIPSIVNKLLKLFTKGSFNPSEIQAHFVSQERLEDLVREGAVGTLSQDDEGKIYAVNSKGGRNDEIPAHVTQFCCMQILENTLQHYNILANYQEFQFPTTTSPSHQRSVNLVNRAFLGREWRLPSMLDTEKKNNRHILKKLVPESSEIDESTIVSLETKVKIAFEQSSINRSSSLTEDVIQRIVDAKATKTPQIELKSDQINNVEVPAQSQSNYEIDLGDFIPSISDAIVNEKNHYSTLLALCWIRMQEAAGLSLNSYQHLIPEVQKRIQKQLAEEFDHAEIVAKNPDVNFCFGASVYKIDDVRFGFFPFVGFSGKVSLNDFQAIYGCSTALSESDAKIRNAIDKYLKD